MYTFFGLSSYALCYTKQSCVHTTHLQLLVAEIRLQKLLECHKLIGKMWLKFLALLPLPNFFLIIQLFSGIAINEIRVVLVWLSCRASKECPLNLLLLHLLQGRCATKFNYELSFWNSINRLTNELRENMVSIFFNQAMLIGKGF